MKKVPEKAGEKKMVQPGKKCRVDKLKNGETG